MKEGKNKKNVVPFEIKMSQFCDDESQPEGDGIHCSFFGLKSVKKMLNRAVKMKEVYYYTTIHYHGEIYELGQYIEVLDASYKDYFVGILTDIIRIGNDADMKFVIEVQWCLRKHQLPEQFNHIQQHVSKKEIFPSQQKYYQFMHGIRNKCQILTLYEIVHLQNVPSHYYFIRTRINLQDKTLHTSAKEWKLQCVCRSIINPDIKCLSCNQCDKVFHIECVGLTKFKRKYLCQNCETCGYLRNPL